MFFCHLNKISLLITFIFLSIGLIKVGHAQTSFPEFSLSNEQATANPKASINKKNIVLVRPLTKDILILQEQINILQALVSRQAEIGKIADNFEKMGIPFVQPSPELSACKKLPFNLLCLYAFPDLEEHQVVIEETGLRAKRKQEEAMMIAIEELTAQLQEQSNNNNNNTNIDILANIDDDIIDNIVMNLPEQEDFAWSDIQCIQSKCSALFVSTIDDQKRVRANVGDALNDDIKVSMISPFKISAVRDNETFEIAPLPLDGIPKKTSRPSDNNRAANIQAAISRNAPPNFTRDDIETPDLPQPRSISPSNTDSNGQETPVLLGPTGLF